MGKSAPGPRNNDPLRDEQQMQWARRESLMARHQMNAVAPVGATFGKKTEERKFIRSDCEYCGGMSVTERVENCKNCGAPPN